MIERHEEEDGNGGWDGKWSDAETEVGIKRVVEGGLRGTKSERKGRKRGM